MLFPMKLHLSKSLALEAIHMASTAHLLAE
jgi:hypothetical protein